MGIIIGLFFQMGGGQRRKGIRHSRSLLEHSSMNVLNRCMPFRGTVTNSNEKEAWDLAATKGHFFPF